MHSEGKQPQSTLMISPLLRNRAAKHSLKPMTLTLTRQKPELKQMPKHSKRWWQLSNALVDNTVPRKGIPPLKSEHCCWLYDGNAKANNFATTFCSKYNLPDDFADFDYHSETEPCIGFLILRRRWALKVLRDLRNDQATGPDRLPAAIPSLCKPARHSNHHTCPHLSS